MPRKFVGNGTSDDSTPIKRSQKARLDAWITVLEQERVMDQRYRVL